MEYYSHENGFLEELVALRSEPLEAILPMAAMDEFYSSNHGWNYSDAFGDSTIANPQAAFEDSNYSSLTIDHQSCINSTLFGDFFEPFGGELLSPAEALTDSSNNNKKQLGDTPPPPLPPPPPPFLHSQDQDYSAFSSILNEDEDQCLVANVLHCLDLQAPCKVEPLMLSSSAEVASFNMGINISQERKDKVKNKVNGQPSKNLMAERRRRKRLNDRLSMLRSVVPKISKMDRTSILGDTIDYIKELLEKINNLQGEIDQEGSDQLISLMSIFKDVKPNEALVKNSPKFDVERRNTDTRIEICCAGKPGLLLSTVTTLEAFGLEIQQCVISCFNDFSIQASCSEEMEQREVVSSEEIKQGLFRNAGYGGRCL